MKQTSKQPAEKRRTQLINAAKKIFGRKGYAGATTEEIARAAKLTKGALYFHFKSKEDIFFEVVKDLSERENTAVMGVFEKGGDPEEVIDESIHIAFEMIEKEKHFTMEFWQQAQKIPRIRNYITDQHDKLEEKITDYLMKHSDLKRKECDSFFILLNAIFDGVIMRRIMGHSHYDLIRLEEEVKKLAKLYFRKNKLQLD